MSHKNFEVPFEKGYLPLQVGSEGSIDLGYLKDNSGNQISEKNKSYCELTGMYWIWKNVECDIVGVCHYRRYFTKRESVFEGALQKVLLDTAYIEECLKTYDVIVPNSGMTMERNVRAHYEKQHNRQDLNICEQVLKEKYPMDYSAFEWSLDRNLMSLGNMMIAPKNLFDEYCNWLFDILFEVERRINVESYDGYQRRVFGFLAERLFRVWLLNHPLKIKEENVIFLSDR